MKVGIVFDLKNDYMLHEKKEDYYDFCFFSEAEAAYKNLILAGYEVSYIGSPKTLLKKIKDDSLDCDIIYNIAEGYLSRNREGIVPSICEAFNIPYTGTDAFGLSMSLHKYQTSCFLEKKGVSVPVSFLFDPISDNIDQVMQKFVECGLTFPVILKPNHEGSSMGLILVKNVKQLKNGILDLTKRFNQEILIQEFISGMELSACILGTGKQSYAYSVLEYVQFDGKPIDVFTKQLKVIGNHKMKVPDLPENVIANLKDMSVFIHKSMGLNDISRIDWKYDNKRKKIYCIEVTPLPDLSEGTEFYISAKMNGQSYAYVFSQIIKSATKRYSSLTRLMNDFIDYDIL